MEEVCDAIKCGNIPQLQAKIREIEDINQALEDGTSLMHAAAKARNPFMMQLLISKKADIHAKDLNGATPLHYSVQSDHEPSIQLLLRLKADCTAVDSEALLPIHYAAKYDSVHAIKVLLQKTPEQQTSSDNYGKTPFLLSVENGSLNTVKYLLENGSSISEVSTDQQTALHIAATTGQLAMLKYLIDCSADIDALTTNSETPYDLAKKSENKEVLKFFKKQKKQKVRSASSSPASIRKSRKKETESTGIRGIALFPYSRELLGDEIKEGDLEFEQNAVITEITKNHNEWWEGTHNGQRGLFPAAFVSTRCISIMKVTHNYKAQRDDELSLEKGKTVRVYSKNENNWFLVIHKVHGGMFPGNFLSEVKSRNTKVTKTLSCGAVSRSPVIKRKLNHTISVCTVATPSPRGEKIQAKVVKKYDAQHPGDLQLSIDSIVELTKSKGAWWEGICDGNKGIFPAKCVEKL